MTHRRLTHYQWRRKLHNQIMGFRYLTLVALMTAVALAASASSPTFHKDIEPIFQARCQSCHRPGEVASMPLLSYQDARPWAKAIRAAIVSGKMPPWSPDPNYGKFSNDLSLPAGEKEKIIE